MKKRKLSAAHLKALQAGLAKWKKRKNARKATSTRRRKAAKKRKRYSGGSSTKWWVFKQGGRCHYGKGTRAEALRKAHSMADRRGEAVDFCGPFASRDSAVAVCT